MFSCLLAISMSSLEKCQLRSSTNVFFFDWAGFFFPPILSYMNCLYILEINHLSVGLQIFFPILRAFCLILSFAVQKLLSLIRYYLVFIFIMLKWVKKDFAVIYITECSVYGFL